jgi:hypothetical protein
VEWDNHRVGYLGIVEGQVLGYTDNAALASDLGWILKNGRYEGEVPLGYRRHIVHEYLKGELDGEEVDIIGESDDYYKVSVSGGEIIRKWKLYMWDKCEWEGALPKHAFSRVWVDERRGDC